MKKLLLIFVSILAVLVTGAVLVFVLVYTGVIDLSDTPIIPADKVYQDEDGHIYTESRWEWHPIESKEVISYIPNTSVKTRTLHLLLHDSTYYDITVPDIPYIYDYGKTIWAVDGSYMVRIMGDADIYNLASLAGIDNGENINQYTLRNVDGKKGARTLATLIGDYVIIVNVYQGDENYSVLYDSIANNRETYEISEVPYAKSLKQLQNVSYEGKYAQSITADGNSLVLGQQRFQEGSLRWRNVTEKFDDACNTYLIQLSQFSETGLIEEVYRTDNVLYARSGSYYLLIVNKTSNMCFLMLGCGEEANCNIVFNMMHLIG